jgi:hypothetical protein
VNTSSHDKKPVSKRIHDLRNARDGLKTLLGLMQKGFPFHSDPRGQALLQSMEKYIAVVAQEVEELESQS